MDKRTETLGRRARAVSRYWLWLSGTKWERFDSAGADPPHSLKGISKYDPEEGLIEVWLILNDCVPDFTHVGSRGNLRELVCRAWKKPISFCQAFGDEGEGFQSWAIIHLSDDELDSLEFSAEDEIEMLVKMLEAAP
jgi:hypothetical protein